MAIDIHASHDLIWPRDEGWIEADRVRLWASWRPSFQGPRFNGYWVDATSIDEALDTALFNRPKSGILVSLHLKRFGDPIAEGFVGASGNWDFKSTWPKVDRASSPISSPSPAPTFGTRKSENHLGAFFTSLVFFLMAVGIVCLGLYLSWESSALAARGVEIYATTSGASTLKSNGSVRSYNLEYTFSVDGATYHGSKSVPTNLFNRFANSNYYVPRSIKIQYLPENPRIHRIAEPGVEEFAGLGWLWIVVLILGGLGGLGMFYSLRDMGLFKGVVRKK